MNGFFVPSSIQPALCTCSFHLNQKCLRQRVYDRLLPQHQGHLIDKNFTTRLLYKDIFDCPIFYISGLHFSLLMSLTALCQSVFNKEEDGDDDITGWY